VCNDGAVSTTPAVTHVTAPASKDPYRWLIPATVVAVVVSRIPYIPAAMSSDEAGYMMVGRQWDGPGRSMYTNYWVDRPPLLVDFYGLAAHLGGQVALRMMGIVLAVALVLATAWLASVLRGKIAARWAAVVCAILLVSPLLGAQEIDGELIASPFVMAGIACIVSALAAKRYKFAWMFTAGLLAVCAALIKQNFIDIAMYGAIVLVVMLLRREVPAGLGRMIGGFAAGAVVMFGLAALRTYLGGTTFQALWYAMYEFRILAGQQIANHSSAAALEHLAKMLLFIVLTGMAALPVVVGYTWWSSRKTQRLPATELALPILLGWVAFSIAAGGGYWSRYLIQSVGEISVLVGICALSIRKPVRIVVIAMAVSSVFLWSGQAFGSNGNAPRTIGQAVGASGQPGDTMLHFWSRANVNYAAKMESPYPYLWDLIVKVNDPHMTLAIETITGPNAPTWIVAPDLAGWGKKPYRLRLAVFDKYHPIGRVCGEIVYLKDGLERAPIQPYGTCKGQRISGGLGYFGL
jgi:hypothetical protein